jgi:hypothetical protein
MNSIGNLLRSRARNCDPMCTCTESLRSIVGYAYKYEKMLICFLWKLKYS